MASEAILMAVRGNVHIRVTEGADFKYEAKFAIGNHYHYIVLTFL